MSTNWIRGLGDLKANVFGLLVISTYEVTLGSS